MIIKNASDIKIAVAFDKDVLSQTQSHVDVQKGLTAVLQRSLRNGLSLNINKCTTLHFGVSNPHCQYFLGNRPLNQGSMT